VGGDDAVVEDVVDVWLGGEAFERGGVVFGGGRLDGGDAKVLVPCGEAGSGGGYAGFGVGGDGGVAIENEVAVRSDAVGVDLGSGKAGEKQRKKDGAGDESACKAGRRFQR